MYEQVNDKNDNISEINIVNNKKKFDFYDVDYDYISPYNYDDYFKKNISFNSYTQNITYLINYSIQDCEILFLRKFYDNSSIGKKRLKDIIHKDEYQNFIELLIIIKRLEYLNDYLIFNNFDSLYLIYIDNIINTLRNNKKNFINNLNV